MQIIEQFIEGKTGGTATCEDKIVATPDFIAILDGVTSRAGHNLRGVSIGRFATGVVAEAIAALPADIDAAAAIARLGDALAKATAAAAAEESKSFGDIWARPATALILYSRARREVWRVADSSALIGGHKYMKLFPQEKIWCDFRHAHIHALLARGISRETIEADDPTWQLLTPVVADFWVFANYDGPYGFGVLNGTPVPARHIEVFPAPAGEVVLASDGYPDIFPTLAATEAHLQDILRRDPLLIEIAPQAKGRRRGWVSYDDRSYIRFAT